MAFAAALPLIGGAAGSFVASHFYKPASRQESAIYQPQTTFNPTYSPQNNPNFAPTYNPHFAPHVSPQYSPENIADQRNSPQFNPRINVFIGGNEMVELCNVTPAHQSGHRLISNNNARVQSEYTPPAGSKNQQSNTMHLPGQQVPQPNNPSSRWQAPSPTRLIALATIGGCMWGVYKLRKGIKHARTLQAHGWCSWKRDTVSLDDLAAMPHQVVAQELLKDGMTPDALIRSLDTEIEQLQQHANLVSTLNKFHLGKLCGISPQEHGNCQEAIARDRLLKHKISELITA
jgi:hypothetical protein